MGPDSCSTSADCEAEETYCAGNGKCLPYGQCDNVEDCANRENSFMAIECVGRRFVKWDCVVLSATRRLATTSISTTSTPPRSGRPFRFPPCLRRCLWLLYLSKTKQRRLERKDSIVISIMKSPLFVVMYIT